MMTGSGDGVGDIRIARSVGCDIGFVVVRER